jgi:hypothetical protein
LEPPERQRLALAEELERPALALALALEQLPVQAPHWLPSHRCDQAHLRE